MKKTLKISLDEYNELLAENESLKDGLIKYRTHYNGMYKKFEFIKKDDAFENLLKQIYDLRKDLEIEQSKNLKKWYHKIF